MSPEHVIAAVAVPAMADLSESCTRPLDLSVTSGSKYQSRDEMRCAELRWLWYGLLLSQV